MFAKRVTKPEKGNKYYNNGNKGGWSWCVNGSPTDSGCNVLANCVGYACGRFNEIIGSMKYKTLCCNAENFIERAQQAGLEIVNYPVLGGIMVWQKGATLSGNDGAGHVAIVEDIYNSNEIYTSESGYGSSYFWNSRRNNNNGRWGLASSYTFRGCIVNPAVGKVTTREEKVPVYVDTTAGLSDEQIANMIINGPNKWGDGDARKNALGSRYAAVQAIINQKLSKPAAPAPAFDLLLAVKKTIRGDYGNGATRRAALGSHFDEVQAQVNKNFANGTTRWDNIRIY